MLGYELHDLIGNLGVLCILATYLLLQLERIVATSVLYSVLNALGSGMIVYSLMFEFNLSAFIVELAWLFISLFGLTRRFYRANPS